MAYLLRPFKAPLALIAGSGVAAVVTAVAFNWMLILDPIYRDRALLFTALTFGAAFVVWALGLLVVGLPAWIILHRQGRRAPAHALILGLAATFSVFALLSLVLSQSTTTLVENGRALILAGERTPYGWFILFKDSTLTALLGGAVATLIWRIAYRVERP